MEKQTLIEELHKTSVEKVKVHVQGWKGNTYIDVRVWQVEGTPGDTSDIATKKGICMSVELLPDLIRILQKAWDFLWFRRKFMEV